MTLGSGGGWHLHGGSGSFEGRLDGPFQDSGVPNRIVGTEESARPQGAEPPPCDGFALRSPR